MGVSRSINLSTAILLKGNRTQRTLLPFLGVLALLLVQSGCSLFRAPPLARYIEYTVKGGDSIVSIAERFDSSSREIRKVNHIPDGRGLRQGQIIRIPYRGQVSSRAPNPRGGSGGSAKVGPLLPRTDKASAGLLKSVPLGAAARYVGRLTWPVRDAKVSSRFGWRWLSFHEGIDLPAPIGTRVVAAHDGVVVYSDDGLRGYGNLVVLKGRDIVTVYGHNKRNLARVGDQVRQGEHIADVGNSGKSTGAHMHFEIRLKDSDGKLVAVDPLTFYP